VLIIVLQLPPHILTVYRRSDLNKTELIAKHVREGSNELDILKYLHTIRPQSPHVISLIEAIPSNTEWLSGSYYQSCTLSVTNDL
jgi:hypothetical protein